MKKLSVLLMAGFMATAIALTGCGSETGGTPGQGTPTQDAPEEAQGTAESNFRLMLAENQPAENPISIGMQMFADLVYEKTDGTVFVDVFLDGQLGSESDTLTQVQANTLDMVRANVGSVVPIADSVGAFMLPFIFADDDHKYRVLDGEIGQSVARGLEAYNFIVLEYWEAGSRNFYTSSRPIQGVEDLQGMMIRVMPVEMAIRMVEALGAAAVPMPFAEVYTALQTGVIDGAENDFVSYQTSGHFEVARYFTLTGHMSPPAVLLLSKQVYDQMSPRQQTAIREAAREAALWQRTAMKEFQDEARAIAEAGGSVIIEVDVAPFQAAMVEVYEAYPQFADIIEAIQALQ